MLKSSLQALRFTHWCSPFSQQLLTWFIVAAACVEKPALPIYINDIVMCPQFYLPHTDLLWALKPLFLLTGSISLIAPPVL